MSACSFSTLRLNLVLTHGIAPDVHGGVHIFSPHPLLVKSMFKCKILVLLLLYCMDTFSLRLMPVQELKKNSRAQVTCKVVGFRFFLTHRSKSTLVQPTESRELYTHRTIVERENKSPTAIAPRRPDNRRELRVHATTVYLYVCIVITYSRSIRINRKVANPVHMIN